MKIKSIHIDILNSEINYGCTKSHIIYNDKNLISKSNNYFLKKYLLPKLFKSTNEIKKPLLKVSCIMNSMIFRHKIT